ncbi:hypothetical protein LRS74_19140 [Streptomyces sp. LX-29]|uniref:hypothetical protein n=1 Tax=Streptomyces sp. LX-29 TaxID=2900152 RepID=UPI00240CFF45|nr:hypothetical protein [Streptomyces sp. LX-29]WFB11727.1 hypothetical protein LRS74_19140 [Streptomyces sp. LX-29]
MPPHASAHPAGHGEDCGCARGARDAHRRAVSAFAELRDRLADGQGLPAALAHSAGASRQWVSDELRQAARGVAERGRAQGAAWLAAVWKRAVAWVWGVIGVLLLVQLVTALVAGDGWSVARTAGLVASLVTGALLTLAAWLHRSRGGPLAPLIGEDNRLSTSRAVAVGWVLLAVFAVLLLAVERAADSRRGSAAVDGLDLARSAALLTVVALTCLVAVLARLVVANRVRGQRTQKVRADRPRAADLLTDDAGRGSFTDAQYVVVNAAAVVFAAVLLAREPRRLPELPWALAVLAVVSAVTYLAGKYAEGGRPTVLSVVRAREAGDLDAPIRTGDDIEIRGSGFVPPGAQEPDRLAQTVVRIGTVHVHVPLIPVAGGFTNPTDTVLTVPVPVDVEPGRVEVLVITASGAETNRYPIDVVD